MISASKTPWILIAVAAAIAIVALLLPPIPQPLSYHNFADQRAWLAIPNFGDVASNLGFLIVGIWGLIALFTPGAIQFADRRERWPYIVMFAGMILTAFGSSYYHLAPDNARLAWDRLPMTIVFMALIAAMIAERISVRVGLWSMLPLVLIGVASVLAWRESEIHAHGDLRFYAAVQIYCILVLLLMLVVRAKYTRNTDFLIVVGFYILAKVLETYDHQVFASNYVVSGHTLKHLAAAMGGYWILRMLKKRELLYA